MYRDELLDHIYDLIPSEEERLRTGKPLPSKFYEYLDLLGRKDERGVYHLPDSHFAMPVRRVNPTIWGRLDASPHQKNVLIKKASRFYPEPFAYADFISIRYVYSGRTLIRTLDSEFYLNENDLCLLSHGFTFSQHLKNREDVVFTIMFEKDYLLGSVLEDVAGGEIIARFILNYICGNKNPQNYILFHGGRNDRIRHTFEGLAADLGYNSSYLSRMIKEGTGTSFKDLILQKRMEHAAVLLKNSSLSIHEVMLNCGLSNETYFYKKFKEFHGCLPKEMKTGR